MGAIMTVYCVTSTSCCSLQGYYVTVFASLFVKGEFSDGLMHGSGKYTWNDGVTYEVSYQCYYFMC